MPRAYNKLDTLNGPDGKYVIRDDLGTGGQFNVYLAYDPLGQNCCLKVLIIPDAQFAQRQLDLGRRLDAAGADPDWAEARNHVVAPHLYFVDGDHILIERYANAKTLAHYLTPDKRIVYPVARYAFRATILGLLLMHVAGIAHLDVKPENIVCFEDMSGAAMVDLGLASSLLRRPVCPGFTPGYSPPEQFVNTPAGTASDVYSMGATMYHALAGGPPFSIAPSLTFHGDSWTSDHANALRQANTPEPVIACIERMLNHEPCDRPALREVFKTLN